MKGVAAGAGAAVPVLVPCPLPHVPVRSSGLPRSELQQRLLRCWLPKTLLLTALQRLSPSVLSGHVALHLQRAAALVAAG